MALQVSRPDSFPVNPRKLWWSPIPGTNQAKLYIVFRARIVFLSGIGLPELLLTILSFLLSFSSILECFRKHFVARVVPQLDVRDP